MAHNDNRDILKWKRTIDRIQSNEQPVDEPMAEGTWSVPETPEQVQKLTTLLKNPLDAETALDELYDVFGDDELFDDLEVMKRDEPETDVRHVVIRRLKDMNFIKEVRENAKQVEEAVGEFADPIYDLIDDLGASDNHPVLNDLVRYLDGDTIKDFVADFRRNNDLNHPGEDGDYGEDDKNFESAEDHFRAKAKKHHVYPVSAGEEVWFNYEDIGGNIIVNPKSTIEDQIAELLNRYYDISPMEFDPSKIEITTPDQTNQDADFAKTQNARNTESIKEGGVHKLRVDQQTHVEAEHHNVVISSNDMGIIVDIYDKNSDNIDTNTYWNDDVMEESQRYRLSQEIDSINSEEDTSSV